jgi:hypothetical protein
MAKETTWGTFVTPSRWFEFESETLEYKPKRIVGVGLANGLAVQRNATRQQTTSTVNGDIKWPMYYKSMGLFLGGIMGTLTTTAVQQSATIGYLQTHALAVNTIGQSLSFQKGVPEVTTGTIRQYNYFGAKITKAVFECAADQFLQATYSIDAKGYDTSNAYATPVYQTPNPIFAFNQGTFKLGSFGSEVAIEGVRKWTMTIERPLRVDNFYLDGTGLKQEQVGNNFVKITVDLESEYVTDAAFVAQFNTDTAQSMIMDFVGPTIASTFKNEIQFQVPNLRWETGQPLIAGPDLVMPKLQLVGLYDDSHTAATITYMSTDTTL